MRETWDGQHLSGLAPEGVPVSVTIGRESLRLERPGAETLVWTYRSLLLTQGRQAGEPVRLELTGTDNAVVVPDRAFLDAVRRLAPGAALTRSAMAVPPGERASGSSRTGLWVVGTIAAVAAAYFWVLPAVGGLLALRVPVEWEVDLGNDVADALAPAEDVCNDPRLTGVVNGIVTRLAAAIPDSPYDFRVSVVDDTLVNAFAAPGGRIIVMRGLLQQSATPEELAGVLAHEMQHVELRHGTRALLRALPLQAAISVMGGGADGSAALVGTLGALRYARGDESEADREGMRLLLASAVDPRGMISFFETLAAQPQAVPEALTYFSTHPATEERRAQLTALAADAGLSRPIDLPTTWDELKVTCRRP